MSLATDGLIDRLGADLRPVRRLLPPLFRAGLWLGVVAAIAALLAGVAKLGSIEQRLAAQPDMWLAVLGAVTTMLLAAIATFQLSMPDRSAGWALLPLPGVALWIGASGLGCLRQWLFSETHPATLRDSGDCFGFIIGMSIPLTAVTVVMLRRGCTLHPNLTAATAGLAIAAAAATLLTFFHPYDASLVDLLVHALAVAIVIAANRALSGWLLAPSF